MYCAALWFSPTALTLTGVSRSHHSLDCVFSSRLKGVMFSQRSRHGRGLVRLSGLIFPDLATVSEANLGIQQQ